MARPSFFLVGAAESGTTALYHALREHEDVYLPETKESHVYAFLADPPKLRHLFEGEAAARRRLAEDYAAVTNESAIGDASTSSLVVDGTAAAIAADAPAARIVAILRHGCRRDVTMAGDLRIIGVRERARDQLATVVQSNARLLRELQLAMATGPALTRDAALGVLVLAVAVVVVAADVSLTVLGAIVVLVMRALTHTKPLSTTLHRLADRWANLTPITARLEDWRPQLESGRRRCRHIGAVELRAVSFAHAPDAPDALCDVSLVVAEGEQLGIIGPTGAGKSTLAAVLLGLLRQREGHVLVDGVPLEEIDPCDRHARTAWVGQSPTLLTEVAIRETLAALRGRASVVVIAHRLSTISACDRVAVLRHGQVVALGPPAELAHDDAYYRDALALSASGVTRP